MWGCRSSPGWLGSDVSALLVVNPNSNPAVATPVAAGLPLAATVAELADTTQLGGRMPSTGRRLVEDHGAAVLVLGCAGMAHDRADLERSLGVTVVDPTQVDEVLDDLARQLVDLRLTHVDQAGAPLSGALGARGQPLAR